MGVVTKRTWIFATLGGWADGPSLRRGTTFVPSPIGRERVALTYAMTVATSRGTEVPMLLHDGVGCSAVVPARHPSRGRG